MLLPISFLSTAVGGKSITQSKLMVAYKTYCKLFSWAFFEIVLSDCLAQLTEMQTGKERTEAIEKKLNAL